MRVKRRFSTRWGHPYHLPGACAKCRQARLRPLCFIPSMIPKRYMEWSAQSTAEDPSEEQTREQKARGRQHGPRSCCFVKAGGTLTLALSRRERGQSRERGIVRALRGA